MTTATHLMSANDLWEHPSDGMRHELIRGELTTMAPSGGEHGTIIVNLTVLLGSHIRAKRLGKAVGAEVGFILKRNPDTVRAPDFAFIRKSRVPRTGIPKKFIPFAPDLAVEVLSPSDSALDMEEKVAEWLAAGTKAVWVVNPNRSTVSIYERRRRPLILEATDKLDGGTLLPGFTCRVREFFE